MFNSIELIHFLSLPLCVQVGSGMDPDTDIGPIITQEAQQRIEALIQAGVDDGADLLLDGR